VKFDQVEGFVALANYGSLAKAAEMLSAPVGAAALSLRIKQLEQSLGVALFENEPGPSRLTIEGRRFLPFAYRLLNSITEARESVSHEETLRIAAAGSLCAYVLPEILGAVRARHPDTALAVATAPSAEILNLVYTRQADVGVRYARGQRELLNTEEIAIQTVDEDPLLLLHLKSLDVPKSVRLDTLSKRPLIVFEKGSTSWAMTHDLFRQAGLHPNVVCEVDSVETAKKVVERGIGFCFLPQRAVQRELAEGTLIQVGLFIRSGLKKAPDLNRRIELIRRSGTTSPAAATVCEALNLSAKLPGVEWRVDPVSGWLRQVERRT
jgi:DNA-binding transcriptional LysR family regulator